MSYKPFCPFWIDTDAYTARDRQMFCAGFEYSLLLRAIQHDRGKSRHTIRKENESRVRMACARFGRRCDVRSVSPVWSCVTIHGDDDG